MILSKHVHFTIGVHLGFFGVFVFVFSVVFFFSITNNATNEGFEKF